MANTVKFKRGVEANRSGQTPAAGEPLWASDTKKLYVGDGSTSGGISVSYTHPEDGGGNSPALTGAVVYDDITINTAGHVTATSTRTLTLANLGYTGETNATADQTNAEIETAYNSQVSTVSQVEAEAGTSTTVRRWTAQRVAQAIAALASGGGGGGTLTSVKTANYTASAGEMVPCDTSSSSWTLTLPASPSAGDQVWWLDYDKTFGTNKLVIGRNSQKIMGLSEDMDVATDNANVSLIYVNSTQGWILT